MGKKVDKRTVNGVLETIWQTIDAPDKFLVTRLKFAVPYKAAVHCVNIYQEYGQLRIEIENPYNLKNRKLLPILRYILQYLPKLANAPTKECHSQVNTPSTVFVTWENGYTDYLDSNWDEEAKKLILTKKNQSLSKAD
jgi:hypothetical protein